MAKGVVAELNVENRSYYKAKEVMQMLGVGKTKAYQICKNLTTEYQDKGILSKEYPSGKVPKKLFNDKFMIERM